VAVIVNRPFDGGLLFNRIGQRPVPEAAREAVAPAGRRLA